MRLSRKWITWNGMSSGGSYIVPQITSATGFQGEALSQKMPEAFSRDGDVWPRA